MEKIRLLIGALLLLAVPGPSGTACSARGVRTAPQVLPSDSELRERGRRGLDLLMNGDLDGAISIFRDLQASDPQAPVGYLLEADAVWWRIFYASANLVDPEVFVAAGSRNSPYDAHFEDLLQTAISKSEARIRANQEGARNHLYTGMAYGLRARLAALRDKRLPTARAGKKMRALLLKALELDPSFTDAYLGVGIYNYFVDTLSPIVKLLRFFIGLPGGSRVEGLQQLEQAARKGDLTRAEAKFYLAKNLSRQNERQYARSQELFLELAREYPQNPFWVMSIGSLHFRLGRPQEGETLYQEVFKRTVGDKSDVNQALHCAARLALERRHPGGRFVP